MRARRGMTIIEILVVVIVVAILASAFTYSMVPMLNTFFYFPQAGRVNGAAADLLKIIVEGDGQARGLRFAGAPCLPDAWLTATAYTEGDYVSQGGLNYFCLVNHTSGTFATDLSAGKWTSSTAWAAATGYTAGNIVSYGGYVYTCISNHTSGALFMADLGAGRWAVNPIVTATGTTLKYYYSGGDSCGTAGRENNSVTITYDAANRIVTRSINGGTAVPIPDYVTAGSDIKFDRFESNADGLVFFRYYNSAGTEMTSGTPITTYSIYRVDVAVESTSGTGTVTDNMGNIRMKVGASIRRYTS